LGVSLVTPGAAITISIEQIQKGAMKALQISKHGIPTEVVELVDIAEPDAPKAERPPGHVITDRLLSSGAVEKHLHRS
jgi:hypothetical protein